MDMNPNVSSMQMKPHTSMAKYGAMPIKTGFDGPAPIKEDSQQGVMQPGKSINLPKPGFF
jgi:hypothetical protein